uniref:Uncharacterized protein n=1 Tax=Siphoviridae sp. ct6YY1 TaxID=2825343 RepID=A0A8S5V3A8_9CAUD|nr:MAG TPA: hypothetical protein [Siphoviridae sp. ct6YY1]DAQ55636.1 MAG TPA: hypothetical protein [Caudoviricetes sp.]
MATLCVSLAGSVCASGVCPHVVVVVLGFLRRWPVI